MVMPSHQEAIELEPSPSAEPAFLADESVPAFARGTSPLPRHLASPLGHQQRFQAQLRQVIDAGLLIGALAVAYLFRSLLVFMDVRTGGSPLSAYVVLILVIAIGGPYTLSRFGFYAGSPSRPWSKLWTAGKSIGTLVLVITGATFVLKDQTLSRIIIVAFAGFGALFVWVRDLLWERWSGVATASRTVILFGTPAQTREVSELLVGHPQWRIVSAATVDSDRSRAADLVPLLHSHHADSVIVCGLRNTFERIQDVVQTCETEGVDVWVLADLVEPSLARMSLDRFHGQPILRFHTRPDHGWGLLVKRCIDVAITAVALLIVGPLVMLPTAIVIRLTSKGPILFRQVRSGLHGKTFTMYKFRSMVSDAEDRRADLDHLNEQGGPIFKIIRDPRLTRVGRFIRKTSIDELPQLFNVLRGDMSIVGPRPPIPSEVAKYDRWQRRRLSMKPGLTCIWQVSGRSNLDFETWMKLDLQYIDQWSLALDLRILAKTIPAVITGHGAH
jgi:exopolysaccharide biosynthesis polyprenyl glycosylphosphotransferase